jgi:hypothetical protein
MIALMSSARLCAPFPAQEGAKNVHWLSRQPSVLRTGLDPCDCEGEGKAWRERGERAEGTCEGGLGAEGLDDWLDLS